jgi:hypothetical protein
MVPAKALEEIAVALNPAPKVVEYFSTVKNC